MNNFVASGTANLEGAAACGESLQTKCLRPRPKLTLAASGEIKDREQSKSFFETKGASASIRSILALSLFWISPPPCFPKGMFFSLICLVNWFSSE